MGLEKTELGSVLSRKEMVFYVLIQAKEFRI